LVPYGLDRSNDPASGTSRIPVVRGAATKELVMSWQMPKRLLKDYEVRNFKVVVMDGAVPGTDLGLQ
jgi:hypothetical protein